MNHSLPTVELLEKAHAFPCFYLFKVIGKSDPDFLTQVITIVREELGHDADPPHRTRDSVGGRHTSISIEPMVPSPHHVVAIYRRLGTLEGLVMMF